MSCSEALAHGKLEIGGIVRIAEEELKVNLVFGTFGSICWTKLEQ